MASSSKSPKQPKIPETTQDMISSMPTEVTDRIMKRLPLKMAAKMSMLSRLWRRNWLSHRYLVFDKAFWEEHSKNGKFDWLKISKIISNILLFHNGAVQVFHLYIPEKVGGYKDMSLNISQWLSFLSRVGVKKICISNRSGRRLTIPSHIYACKELVKLRIEFYVLVRLPCEFMGFVHLCNLELVSIDFGGDTLKSLIASCPRLTGLILEKCTVMNNVWTWLDPSSHQLTQLARKINWILQKQAVDGIKTLACSSELQCLQVGGEMFKLFAAGYITETSTLAFNHLHRLCLTELDWSNLGVYCVTFSILRSCPFIKDLHISKKEKVAAFPKIFVEDCVQLSPEKSTVQRRFNYNKNYKLGHLLKVEITGITGSSAEFQLIEYVLATSVVLELLLFKCANLDPSSELKVSRKLLQLPRASAKAKLVCLEQ